MYYSRKEKNLRKVKLYDYKNIIRLIILCYKGINIVLSILYFIYYVLFHEVLNNSAY